MNTMPMPAAPQSGTIAPTNYAMAVEELTSQVKLIQNVMNSVMKPKEHYGTIPGCGDKPTLLKPGAEKLAMTFRFAPKYDIQERELRDGHREYRVVCSLQSIITGAFVGEGIGVGTTMESKYRFRKAEQKCPHCGQPTIIRGKKEYGGGWLCFAKKGGCGAKFKDGDPAIENQEMGRVEHDNPADYYNTVAKMAKKRALVDAVLTATAASDIFTQDIEDFEVKQDEAMDDSFSQGQQAQPKPQAKPNYATREQLTALFSAARAAGFDEAGTIKAAREFFKTDEITDLRKLYANEAVSLTKAIKSGEVAPAAAVDSMDEMPPAPDANAIDPPAASFLAREEAREPSHA